MKTTKISFKHFHNGNDPEYVVRGPAVYATRCRLMDLATGNVLCEAWAYCSPNDAPSREKGREVSRGRLERKLNPHFHEDKNKRRREAHKLANEKKVSTRLLCPPQKASSIANLL